MGGKGVRAETGYVSRDVEDPYSGMADCILLPPTPDLPLFVSKPTVPSPSGFESY
jgi:hypothetical protein